MTFEEEDPWGAFSSFHEFFGEVLYAIEDANRYPNLENLTAWADRWAAILLFNLRGQGRG